MWYAVWVRTGQEEKVLALCERMIQDDAGFIGEGESQAGELKACKTGESKAYEQCFLPKYERARKVEGQWVRQKEVLFPGYLFLSVKM